MDKKKTKKNSENLYRKKSDTFVCVCACFKLQRQTKLYVVYVVESTCVSRLPPLENQKKVIDPGRRYYVLPALTRR